VVDIATEARDSGKWCELCEANLQKDKPLVIGYISSIIGALLFGSVSTVAKPIVSSVNPLLLQ
jgi:hypothetical protein